MRNFDQVLCGGHTGKHRLRIEHRCTGEHVIMKCAYTMCRRPLVVSHEAVRALVSA